MPVVKVDGVDLYYDEFGSGEAVLLIPGASGHSSSFFFQIPELANRFHVIALHNRGAGRSAVPPGPYSTIQMAYETAGLLDRIGIERADVVGHSMGGMIGQELAIGHPGKVNRLVMIDSAARIPDFSGRFIQWVAAAARQGFGARELWTGMFSWFFTPALTTGPGATATLDLILADPLSASPEGVGLQCEATAAHDAIDRLGEIQAPTLIIHGAEDILLPPVCAEEMAKGIPSAQLKIFERGGHNLHVEHPQEINEALMAFLSA